MQHQIKFRNDWRDFSKLKMWDAERQQADTIGLYILSEEGRINVHVKVNRV